MAGREELDTNTLYILIQHIEKRIEQEEAYRTLWHSFAEYKEYTRALEDMLKYIKYLHNMSMYPKDSINSPLPFGE